MADVSQLLRKNNQGGYKNIFPKTYLDNIIDKESRMTLSDILSGFNMYFLSYTGSKGQTRLQVPSILRRTGLWITYVMWDKTIVVEWYASDNMSDAAFKEDANWRVGNNVLVGDITISSKGHWIINGIDSGIQAQGEQGVTPLLRVRNNKLEVSYNNGNYFSSISDYIAAWFRWIGTEQGVGKIQISRDNNTWSDLSSEFTNNLKISDYVGKVSELPSGVALGTIYGVGPTYDSPDISQTNPIYTLYVYTSDGWLDNGHFTSINAGIVQDLGNSEITVISQKKVTDSINVGEDTIIPLNENFRAVSSLNYTYAIVNDKNEVFFGLKKDGSVYINSLSIGNLQNQERNITSDYNRGTYYLKGRYRIGKYVVTQKDFDKIPNDSIIIISDELSMNWTQLSLPNNCIIKFEGGKK